MINRSIAPPIKSIESVELLPLHNIRFPNEIEVRFLHSAESEIIQIFFFFKAGLIHQHKKLLANAFASLVTNGTLHHSAKELAEMLEYYGVFYSVSSSAVYTKFQFTFLKKKLKSIIPIIQEIIQFANFPQEEIDIYIQNQIEQYHTQIKNVSILSQWHFSNIIYGDTHPLNKLHTPQDYQQITRDDLLYFYTTHIHPQNGFILISGNIDDEVLHSIQIHFGEKNFHQTQHTFEEKVPLPQSTANHIYIQMPDAIQSAVKIGCIIPIHPHHPDYFDFMIANVLLGGFFGSRLMSVIREEKGYTYGIYSQLSSYDQFSVFLITSEVKAEYTTATINEVHHQIQKLQQEPPDAEELMVVKNYLSGEILDTTDGLLKQTNAWASIITKHLNNEYYNQLLQRIKNIQSEDISRVMQQYIDIHTLKTCIVGKTNN